MRSRRTPYKRMPTAEIYAREISEQEIMQIKDLVVAHPDVAELWLFGSAARGDTRSGEAGYRRPSDIDLLVVSSRDDSSRLTLASCIYKSLAEARVLRPVDVIVWTREQWSDALSHALGRRVLCEGRKLYQR